MAIGVVKVEPRKLTLPQRTYIPQVVIGMFVTLRHLLKNLVSIRKLPTISYPEVKRMYSERFRGRRVGLVLGGGNIDPLLLAGLIERGMVRAGRLARIRVEIRDQFDNRATSATNGATRMRLSIRSSTPPCPGRSVPESFAPAARLMADSSRSDASPTGPMKAASVRVGPVRMPAEAAMSRAATAAAANPASVPSHVFPGLMLGAIRRRPIRRPTR